MNVTAAYAKANLPELLRAVERGETVTISRYRKPIALLTSAPQSERRIPRIGTVDGIKILDPNWAAPMTEREIDKMLKDRY